MLIASCEMGIGVPPIAAVMHRDILFVPMKQKTFSFFLLLGLLLTSASFVSAHGNSFSYEESKEGYKIDIGYDEFIAAGESVRFDYVIYPEDLDAIEGEVFTDVWVTLTKDRQIYFAGGIHKPAFGATGFTYVFPEEGSYTLSARFQKDGETVVATEFPLEILPPLTETKTVTPLIIYGLCLLAGLVLGAAIMLFIPQKRKI